MNMNKNTYGGFLWWHKRSAQVLPPPHWEVAGLPPRRGCPPHWRAVARLQAEASLLCLQWAWLCRWPYHPSWWPHRRTRRRPGPGPRRWSTCDCCRHWWPSICWSWRTALVGDPPANCKISNMWKITLKHWGPSYKCLCQVSDPKLNILEITLSWLWLLFTNMQKMGDVLNLGTKKQFQWRKTNLKAGMLLHYKSWDSLWSSALEVQVYQWWHSLEWRALQMSHVCLWPKCGTLEVFLGLSVAQLL